MKHLPIFLLLSVGTSILCAADEVIHMLQEEIKHTSEERDQAQKALLHLQKESETRIRTLSENQEALKQELEEADQSILVLQTEASRSTMAADLAQQELAEREAELATLREEAAETRARVQELEALPDEIRNTFVYDEIKSRLGKQLVEIARAESKWKRALTDVVELKEFNQELKFSLQASRRNESLSTAKLKALEARLGALNQQVERLSQERDALVADQKRLNNKVRTLQARLDEAERTRIPPEEMKAVQEALATARQENRQLLEELKQRRAIPDLREAYSALERERDTLREKQTSLQARIQTLEETLEKEREFRNAEEELRRGLETALTRERQQRETLTNREEVPDLRGALAKLERERNLLQAKQQALNTQIGTLQNSLKEERDGRRDERELRRGLEVELNRERRAQKDLQKEIRRLQSGLDAATTVGVEQSDIAEVQMLVTELREENKRLRDESLEARSDVDRLVSELNDNDSRQKMEIRELQMVLGEQMIQLTEAEREIEALEARSVSYETVKDQRDQLIQVRDKSRRDMKVLANHIRELRGKVAQNQQMEQRLQASTEDRQRLRKQIERQERLAQSLKAEQDRKDQQILDLRKRLAVEQNRESTPEETGTP